MAKIHPEYDAKTSTWFVPGLPEVEAPTVCELLGKLRALPGHGRDRVADYYPRGYRAPSQLGSGVGSEGRVSVAPPKFMRYTVPRVKRAQAGLEAAGSVQAPAPEPPAPEPPPKPPRRVQRVHRSAAGPSSPCRSRKYDRERILDMWAAGMSGPDIAAQLGMRSVVPGQIVAEARKRGDSRAKARAPKYRRRR